MLGLPALKGVLNNVNPDNNTYEGSKLKYFERYDGSQLPHSMTSQKQKDAVHIDGTNASDNDNGSDSNDYV